MLDIKIRSVKATLKGTIIRAVKRCPGIFRRRRKWLNETQWWSKKQLEELQLRLLRRIISHAYETVPYYNNMMGSLGLTPDDIQSLEDITKFPILRKTDIRAAGHKLISRKFKKMFMRTAHTGGTTGERLVLKRDLHSIANEHAFVRRQFDWAGTFLLVQTRYVSA